MTTPIDLLGQLAALRLAPASRDTDRMAEILCQELPFDVHEYQTGSEHNGWVIPDMWEVERAHISRGGEIIYDGGLHPLGVIGYSQSFSGTTTLDELLPHLHVHADRPDDLVYHCNLYYRLGKRDWGFSVPHRWRSGLEAGEYEVDLRTKFESGTMKVLDYSVPGDQSETVVLNAHNCHAAQANDDLSGVVTAIEVIRRIAARRRRRYTYRLIIGPEHFGTVFYLAALPGLELGRLKYCVFLESVGNDNRLALQRSFLGNSMLDCAASHHLRHCVPEAEEYGFRQLIGNDETVWEAPGYEVPTITLTRFPYPEYHSSADTVDVIESDRLKEAVEATLGVVDILEANSVMNRQFTGLIALSNPIYDLYISPGGDPSQDPGSRDYDKVWNHLMDCLPRYFDGETTILQVADRHGLPFPAVRNYVRKFAEKGLVTLDPA